MTQGHQRETIQVAVLDSVLYGAARAFQYLGERGQGLLDRIGDGIVDYCASNGYLDESAGLEELKDSLTAFFEENGYFWIDITEKGDMVQYAFRGYQYVDLEKKLQQKGNDLLACPWCIADDALSRRKGGPAQPPGFVLVSRESLPDGFTRRYRVMGSQKSHIESEKRQHEAARTTGQVPLGKVGLPAFEAVEYGLARGFEYLGAQAQLFLDDLADGIIEFLREEFRIPPSENPKQSLVSLASFYASGGLADNIGVDLSSSTLTVSFTNYRYASVLKQLLRDGVNLISCPYTLAARSILRGYGLALGETKWKFEDNRNVVLTSHLAKVEGQDFDEDHVSLMMDSIARP